MTAPRVETHEDHLVIAFKGLSGIAALRSSIIIPYSTIHDARAQSPQWPRVTAVRAPAVHVPGQVALGTFRGSEGKRQFIDLERGAQKSLHLDLTGHPEFDEVEVEFSEPERIVDEVARHRPIDVRMPPVYE